MIKEIICKIKNQIGSLKTFFVIALILVTIFCIFIVVHHLIAKDFAKDSETGEWLSYFELINKGVWAAIFAFLGGFIAGGIVNGLYMSSKPERRIFCELIKCKHNEDECCTNEAVEIVEEYDNEGETTDTPVCDSYHSD